MSKLNRAARGLTFVFGTALVLGIACGSILEANKDAVDSYFKTHSSTLVQKDGGKLFDAFTPDKEYLTEDGKGDSKKIVKAHEDLAKQLKDKTSLRKYVALVHGVIPHDKGVIRAPIGRSTVDRKMQAVVDNGKDAVTHFQVLERYDEYTLVELQLETGRTHQIRVHMQYIGYPLVGDPVYGLKRTIKGNGQFLHAKLLGFTHPSTGKKMVFEAPLPEIFKKTLAKLPKSD